MWAKRDKRLEPLFIRPSSSHMEMVTYLHFHHPQQSQMLPTSTAASSPGPRPTVLWKANSARRRRFDNRTMQPRRHSLVPISEGQISCPSRSQRSSFAEPFCSPVTPHVPIRQRLNSVGQRGSGADICNDPEQTLIAGSNPYLCRRRRMSLLQTLRYQNRQLADSGIEFHGEQSDRDSEPATAHRLFANRSSYSPPLSPIESKDSRRSSSIAKLKNKTFAFFGKRSSRKSQGGEERVSSDSSAKYSHNSENEQPIYSSIDLSAKEARQGKSPSTNDSGRGSQGKIVIDEEHPEDSNTEGRFSARRETAVAVIERPAEVCYESGTRKFDRGCEPNLVRCLSCPQLGLNLRIYHEISRRAMSTREEHMLVGETDSEEDGENDEMFMAITEETLVTDEDTNGKNVADEEDTLTKSAQSSSCEAEFVVEKDDIKYAEKVHRKGSPFEEQKNSAKEDSPAKAFSLQQQQHQTVKRLCHMRVDNGCVADPLVYRSPRPPRSSIRSCISIRSRRQEGKVVHEEEEDEEADDNAKDAPVRVLLESGLQKLTIGYDPELDSSSSLYSDENEDDDNPSSLMLDHYLPLIDSPRDKKNGSQRSSSLSSLITHPDVEDAHLSVEQQQQQRTSKVGIVTQTDLSLVHISDQLSSYLNGLTLASNIQETPFFTSQGMNFLAKHFFEYQSFNNLPQVAVQLHKLPPSQAGADQSASWAPKSMLKAGKNQAAPAARANRNSVGLKLGAHRYGRAGKHEFREWGDKHEELKGEKMAPHKDALTKFLSNEANARRNLFESEFEDRILQTEPETLPERLSRTDRTGDIDLQISCASAAVPPGLKCETEVLTILTYAPQVQFVTATVKKAKALPYNNKPFARVMLFERRRLLEQKQTTVTPTTVCNGSHTAECTRQRSSPSISTSSSSSAGCSSGNTGGMIRPSDVIFSESFLFHVTPQMLDRCHIVIEMFDTDPTDCSHGPIPVGHCVIGPMCPGSGCAHWLQMIRKTGLPICMWHRLLKS